MMQCGHVFIVEIFIAFLSGVLYTVYAQVHHHQKQKQLQRKTMTGVCQLLCNTTENFQHKRVVPCFVVPVEGVEGCSAVQLDAETKL
jgi:hypothetical protein